jgi:hypothetical protein
VWQSALPQGKEPRYPLVRRLGASQSQFGRSGWTLQGIELLSRRARSQPLYRLRYLGSTAIGHTIKYSCRIFKTKDLINRVELRSRQFVQFVKLQVCEFRVGLLSLCASPSVLIYAEPMFICWFPPKTTEWRRFAFALPNSIRYYNNFLPSPFWNPNVMALGERLINLSIVSSKRKRTGHH